MNYWPVPDSYSKSIPLRGSPGCFWEYRGDRFHCGVDIYADEGNDVISVEGGIVIQTGVFTSSGQVPYWNTTEFVLLKNDHGMICRYAELGDVAVRQDEKVEAGQLLGHVGKVLNMTKITETSPPYIRKIKENGNMSMLHFELIKELLPETCDYLGGNWFGATKPEVLEDPGDYLRPGRLRSH